MLTDCMNRELCLSASCERADRDGKRGKIMADENYSYAPKYVQIQNYILQKIESGEYAAGDKIPSETELARQFDVSA